MMAKLFDIFSKKKSEKKEKVKIIIDNREKNSLVVSELMKKGFEVEFRQLPVADYLVRDVAIERKTVSDLKSSVINKRIFQQLLELKQYKNYLLLIEGILDEDMYEGGMHENAFRGFLLSVILDEQVPIVFTHNAEDTAKYLSVLARKQKKPESGIRATKIFKSKKERQQFILEGWPNVGPRKAKALLEKFGNIKNVVNAPEEELKEVLGKRAEEFRELVD